MKRVLSFHLTMGVPSALWASDEPTCGEFYDIEFEIDDDRMGRKCIYDDKRWGYDST